MKNLNIEATKSTPSIKIDSKNKEIFIKGKSYPENSYDFYSPVIISIKELIAKSRSPITATLHLTYINTSSAKSLMNIFDLFEESKSEITVTWLYDIDNELAMESGTEFKEDLSIPFNITPITE